MYKYELIKEDRGDYFVKYRPLSSGSYAYLSLTFLNEYESSCVADAMEHELDLWISRFVVPLMVSSYDNKEDIISLNSVRPSNHLFGFLDTGSNEVIKFWEVVPNETIPKEQIQEPYIRSVYQSLPFQDTEELRKQDIRNRRQTKIGWAIIIFCLVIVPIIIASLDFASPIFGILAFLFSLWKGIEKWLKLTGRWKKSEREKHKEHEDARMKHHHYHCERNPEGFRKLRAENFDEDARMRVQIEVQNIRIKDNARS